MTKMGKIRDVLTDPDRFFSGLSTRGANLKRAHVIMAILLLSLFLPLASADSHFNRYNRAHVTDADDRIEKTAVATYTCNRR
ncbi:MAG: hypothetical protein ACXQS5_04040 [Candidatus Methanospirareceae archaeon]